MLLVATQSFKFVTTHVLLYGHLSILLRIFQKMLFSEMIPNSSKVKDMAILRTPER